MNQPQRTILWIDDSATMLEAFHWRMEDEGFRVLVARDNDEALALLEEHKGEIDGVLPVSVHT